MNTATAITLAALAALTPTLTTLIGIILGRQDTRDVRSEIAALRAEMVALRKDLHADLLVLHERVATVESRQGR